MMDDRRAVAAERRLDISQAGLPGAVGGSSDPYLAAWLNHLNPGQSQIRIESGVIVDVSPGGFAYRVSAGYRSYLWCSPGGTSAGFGAMGARPLTAYAIGTPVFFIRHPQTPMVGTIVAAEPVRMMGSPDRWPADGIWPFIRSGQRVEPAHVWPLLEDARLAAARSTPMSGLDMVDFSAGRPMDATSAGEWGTMFETGVGIFADSFQAYLRVDEATGIFAFYPDQMLRVAGHNYQFASSHKEHEELEDEGELVGWTSTCVYPWEAYGVSRHNQVTPGWAVTSVPNYGLPAGQGTVPVDPVQVQSGTGYAIREPEGYRAIPAARIYDWSGYLGQGGRHQIAAPLQLSWAYPTLSTTTARNAVATANISFDDDMPAGRLGVGPPPGDAPVYDGNAEPVAVFPNGQWSLGSSTYVPAEGAVSGVTAGMWISLYDLNVAGGSAPPLGFLVRVASVSGNSIVVDQDIFEGRPLPSRSAGVRAVVWGSTNSAVVPIPVATRTSEATPVDQPGLVEEQKTLAGRWMLRTVGGIVLAKQASIPTPRPFKRPEDPAGDKVGNYDASGLNSEGEVTHQVQAGFRGDRDLSEYRACMVPDALAYAFNWEGLHPFAYHANDWIVAEEGDAGSALVNQRAPDYANLATSTYLQAPTPAYLDVDHRYGLVPVYENQSYVALLEDGGIVLSDGWGSEIRMTGGGIEFHCAGDIRFHNGRNFFVWSGHDIALRAQDSVDLVAERYDLRTRAGRNHHHLAGNTGCGGFLFETKSVCPAYNFCSLTGEQVTSSGFVVLAPNSQVWLVGQDVVMSLEPTATDGRIVLDAGEDREIHTRSKRKVDKVAADGQIIQLFGESGANEFGATYNIFKSKIFPVGGVVTDSTQIANASTRISYVGSEYSLDFSQSLFTPESSVWAEFSHRTAAQYLSSDLTHWESRWSTIAQGDGQTLPVWAITEVRGLRSDDSTWPHPGVTWMDLGYGRHDYTLTDPEDNWVAINRTENRATYENPTSTSDFYTFEESYRTPFLQTTSPPGVTCSPPPPPPAPSSGCDNRALQAVTLVIPSGPNAGAYASTWTARAPLNATEPPYFWSAYFTNINGTGSGSGSLIVRLYVDDEDNYTATWQHSELGQGDDGVVTCVPFGIAFEETIDGDPFPMTVT